MSKLDKTIISEIKCLGMDMQRKANTSNFASLLGSTNIFYALYSDIMNYKRTKPNWINRDRLIIASRNASSLIYPTLFMAGFDITIDDLKNYCVDESLFTKSLKYESVPGIENTTGLPGEGIGLAVGTCLAERYFSSIVKKVKPKSKLIDYYTYCFCDINDLLTGVSLEALSFAGTQKLNKLVIIAECPEVLKNSVTKDLYSTELDDIFEGMGFEVNEVKGNNFENVYDAIDDARKSKKPGIVLVKTVPGEGSKLANSNKAYKKALTNEDVINLKIDLKHAPEPFSFDEKTRNEFIKNIDERMEKTYNKWQAEYEELRSSNSKSLNKLFALLEDDELSCDFDEENFKINDDYLESTMVSNEKIMNVVAARNLFFLNASSDMFDETKAFIEKNEFMTPDTPLGKNINIGARERAMGAIINGLAMSNIRVVGSTSLAYSDMLKPAIRYSSMMSLPVTYVFADDSLASTVDGEAYTAVEQTAGLISTPGLTVFRPCDINEVIGCWDYVLKNKCPVALSLSQEKVPKYRNTNAKYVKYGAYMIKREKGRLDGVVIASGSDVEVAMEVADELYKESGIDLRVVSMPSMGLFIQQNPRYEAQLLPVDVRHYVITSGSTYIWNRFTNDPKYIFGYDEYVDGDTMTRQHELCHEKEHIKRKIKDML